MSSIYMYHAVGSRKQLEGADPYYAVSEHNFKEQIKLIGESVPLATQLAKDGFINNHCITFDDGHLSNYTVALQKLLECGLGAEFYINTANVGKRNFMSWSQLKEMSELGMTIQSHGHTHPYFSELKDCEIENELKYSKSMIEDNIGKPVIVFAPPGGRYDNRVIRIAKNLGYKCIANSVPGTCLKKPRFLVSRFSILASTKNSTVVSYKRSHSYETLKLMSKYHTYSILKMVLGNKIYDKIRGFVLDD